MYENKVNIIFFSIRLVCIVCCVFKYLFMWHWNCDYIRRSQNNWSNRKMSLCHIKEKDANVGRSWFLKSIDNFQWWFHNASPCNQQQSLSIIIDMYENVSFASVRYLFRFNGGCVAIVKNQNELNWIEHALNTDLFYSIGRNSILNMAKRMWTDY